MVARTHRARKWAARRPVLVRPEGLLRRPLWGFGSCLQREDAAAQGGSLQPQALAQPRDRPGVEVDVEDATPDGGATS